MTATAIVNVALRRIGVTRVASLENDTQNEARVARDIYDEKRRALLNLHNWKFATKRAQLTAEVTAPAFGWTFMHEVPDDFIRLISVSSTEDDNGAAPYKLEAVTGHDRVILANFDPAYLRYVFDLQDANTFSPAFRDLLAYAITPDLAAGLNRSISKEQFNDQRYKSLLGRARAIDGMEDFPDRMQEGDWIGVREEDPTQGWG